MFKVHIFYSGLMMKDIPPTHYLAKKIKALRKEIIRLVRTFVDKCHDNDVIINEIIPSINQVFEDYCNNPPQIRLL